ncbi:MAG: COGs COG3558, partial [uncultured Solirubrobacterales bacterium]
GPPTARPALHRGERAPESRGGRGCLEHMRRREGRRRLHAGLGLAQPRRVLRGPRGDRRLPPKQVGARARLPAPQGTLGLRRQSHLGALRVRVARPRRAVVALVRQRALGVRRARLHEPPRRLDQRRPDRGVRAPTDRL